MSSMISKVKDALKGDKDGYDSQGNPISSGHEGYGSTHTSSGKHHGQGGMPGAFDSGTTGTDTTGTQGYGTAHSTDQHHIQGSGHGHDSAYQKATTGSALDPSSHGTSGHGTSGLGTSGHGTSGLGPSGHGTSKYASEPTQSSYNQEHGSSGHQGTGHGKIATTLAGAGAGGLTSHSSRKQVPDNQLMDPADRESSSNVMDRSRGDYAADNMGSSGTNKLHKRDDARGNYDNSPRSARADQDASLRRDHIGDTTHQTGYADSGRDSGYGDSRTGTSEQPVHNSKLMNKLDPRVDADAVADRDGSGHHNKESGIGGASGLGPAGHHGSHKDRTDRKDYSGRDNTSSYGSPADRALPTRSREDYSTGHHGAEHGSLGHNPTSRQSDYSGQPQSGHHTGSGARAAAAAAGGQGQHGHYGQEKDRQGSQPVPYSMTGAHTSGHDPTTQMVGKVRSHFHCMNCGHKNDASHLTDHQGGAVSGRSALHCMDCGHRNEVGHMLR